MGIAIDTYAWMNSPLLPSLIEFITLLDGPSSAFLRLFKEEIGWRAKHSFDPVGPVYLGRLSIKEEAAGKARVFAITDAITQSVLKPLHDYLFSILKEIPMDGTFDQGAPLDRLLQLHRDGVLVGHKFHSFDLSAATDRLPIRLQRDILGYYTGTRIAELWATLLTDRDWFLKRSPVTGAR
jgi:hypothetical protein